MIESFLSWVERRGAIQGELVIGRDQEGVEGE